MSFNLWLKFISSVSAYLIIVENILNNAICPVESAPNEGTKSVLSFSLKIESLCFPSDLFPILKTIFSPKIADITSSAFFRDIESKFISFVDGKTIVYPLVLFLSRSARESAITSKSHCNVISGRFIAVIGLLSFLAYLGRTLYVSISSLG